jgi:hypothetical protein
MDDENAGRRRRRRDADATIAELERQSQEELMELMEEWISRLPADSDWRGDLMRAWRVVAKRAGLRHLMPRQETRQ